MSEIARSAGGRWKNEHRSIERRMARKAELRDPGEGDLAQWLASRRDLLGGFIADEHAAGNRLTVTGSGWSQSDLYRDRATLLQTDADTGIFAVPDEAFRESAHNRHRYAMVAGGTKIGALMDWLGKARPRLSLATAGSHKGQSVAGMIATGSHGSMLEHSGFECHVRGLVMSTGRGEAQWLAREPVLRDDFVTRFATISDPALFDAALIHLGGMGIVSAVLIEAADDFRIGRTKRMRVVARDWAERCAVGDFAGATGGAAPAYYEISFDPFSGPSREALETIWHHMDGAPLVDPPDPGDESLLDLLARTASAFVASAPQKNLETIGIDVPDMIWDEFRKDVIDEPQGGYRLAQLVRKWEPHTVHGIRVDVYNAAFCVPLERLPEALDIGFTMGAEAWPIRHDYVLTVRFARRSQGAMGFLRFERNAVINIDGLKKGFLLSTCHDAAQDLARRFEKAGLPFSMHWGKDAPSPAEKIARDFGPAGERWKAARAGLLGDNAALFTSPALEEWGLA